GSTSSNTPAMVRRALYASRILQVRREHSRSTVAGSAWQRLPNQRLRNRKISRARDNLMAKTEITKTELAWPGKYNEDGTRKEVPRVSLPLQVIETVNECRATREASKLPSQQS